MNRLFPPLFFVLALAIAACDPQPASSLPGSPAPDHGAVATQVSIQLAAAADATAASSSLVPPAQSDLAGKVLVVYSRAGNLQLWDGAASKQLTSSGQDTEPVLSGDGRVVVFRRATELWAVNADGSGERNLASKTALTALPHTGGGALQADRLAFAPHSHDLYFNTITVPDEVSNPSLSPNEDLVKVNADNPTLQPLLNDSQGGAEFTFSPDGTQIALARQDRINIFKADGSALNTVFSFRWVFIGNDRSGFIPQLVWMPDGSGFKTVIPGPDALQNPSALTRFMFIPADGGPSAQLATFSARPDGLWRPCISPDGAQVLYLKPLGSQLELHIVDASTADKAYGQFPALGIGGLRWAPDSFHFSYVTGPVSRAWSGSLTSQPAPLEYADQITWLDSDHCLFVDHANLRLGHPGRPPLPIASGVDDAFASVLSP